MSTAKSSIILIGPYGSGKTTIAECLEKRLNWPRLSLDDKLHSYLKQLDNYNEVAEQLQTLHATSPVIQPYFAYMVGRFFEDIRDSPDELIIEFGYNHALYENDDYFDHIKQILKPYSNIFLLTPSSDKFEAISTLLANIRSHGIKGSWLSDQTINEMNAYAVQIYSRRNLANFTVYTKGKSPKETCAEIYRQAIPEA